MGNRQPWTGDLQPQDVRHARRTKKAPVTGLIKEVNQYQREELEQAVDMLEHAMQESDPEIFYHARDGVLIILESLGFPYKGKLSSPEDC